MTANIKPMVLRFIGSPEHTLSCCIKEYRFQGVRQLFAELHKFNNEVLDTYCPSNLKPVSFGDFLQVVKEAHLEDTITLYSDNQNHFITVRQKETCITYCLYCVYDGDPEHTSYYLVAIERDLKLIDAVRPNLDREIAISSWREYIKVLDEGTLIAKAFSEPEARSNRL